MRAKVTKRESNKDTLRFEPAKIDSLFGVLDAIAWISAANVQQISQFANIDPRTAGKLLKNATTIGLVDCVSGVSYSLKLAYPFRGIVEQKRAVVREALVKMPLLESARQFLSLGDGIDDAVRKAATVQGVENYDATGLRPLIQWAQELKALEPGMVVDDLINDAEQIRAKRHAEANPAKVAFLSHSTRDKPIVRQIAADLTAEGVNVWLDEQRIHVGDSIPEKIAQGLVESDYFLIALSEHSVASEWVKKEFNQAMVHEISKRKISILPLKLSECEIPTLISDKKYADFSKSYRDGIQALLQSINSKRIKS